MSISFNQADRKFQYPRKAALKKYLLQLALEEGKSIGDLSYVFCSDDYLLGINQQFLQHNTYTDIITFDLAELAGGPIMGEVYISVDRVAENAALFGVPVEEELTRVIFHGLLHLCCYKDKTKPQQKRMREAEDRHLAAFGFRQR